MTGAADRGREGIVQLCRTWGATNVNGGMARAAYRGHESIVRLCRKWGATDVRATNGGTKAAKVATKPRFEIYV